MKDHVNGDRDPLRAHLACRAAGQSPTSRAERVLGMGVCTEVVERLVLRPGVRVRDIEEPRITEEVGSAHRTRPPDHPSRTSEILGRTRDIDGDSANVGEANEPCDDRPKVRLFAIHNLQVAPRIIGSENVRKKRVKKKR